jgi:serine/threonine protein kinase
MDNLELAKTETTLPPGYVLADRYVIGKILGRGGMGIVYLATDQKLDMTVAIKVLNSWLAHDEKSVLNLKEEAKIGMRLVHPNIMRIYNFEDLPAAKFLIMEYIDGLTLGQMMLKSDGRKLPADKAIAYARQICAGLQYAHAQKVLHRDVKPSNIMVDNEGIAKITDFGIACVARDSTSRLLAGDPPFHTGSIEYQILNKTPQPIDGIPDRLNEVLLKALAKNKEQRWASAQEFLEALEGKIEVDSDRKKREAEEKRKLEEARRLAEEKRRVEAEKQRWETERQPSAEVNQKPLVVKLGLPIIKTLFALNTHGHQRQSRRHS